MPVKTIQMTIDEELLATVDEYVSRQGTSRSAFIRQALEAALRRAHIRRLEEEHAAAYRAVPQTEAEVVEWIEAQTWSDE
jgi:metal-responsive CopG/Arc/MetJ family transcriptional regulator